jgi:hypothetical protein
VIPVPSVKRTSSRQTPNFSQGVCLLYFSAYLFFGEKNRAMGGIFLKKIFKSGARGVDKSQITGIII